MQTKTKLHFIERLSVAQTILENVADDFKIMMERAEEKKDREEELINAFLANKACDVSIACIKLQNTILKIEEELAKAKEK